MWVVVVVLAKPRMLVSVGFSFDFVFASNNHNPIRRNQKQLTTWVHVITNSKENILYLLPAITCSYLFRVKLNFQRALESMLRKTKLNCATFRKGIYADKVSFVGIILQITPSHTIAPCQSTFAFSISNHMLCILRWYHWHSGSSRSFAVCRQGAGRWPSALSSQYEFASIECAYAHMLYYYMGDTRTQISSTRMRHSEWADGAERVSSSKRGTVLFYFISFHFFFFGPGSTDWSGGLFCRVPQQKQHGNTNSHTKYKATLRRTEFCGHYGIPDNETKAAAETKPHDTIQNCKRGHISNYNLKLHRRANRRTQKCWVNFGNVLFGLGLLHAHTHTHTLFTFK